MKHKKMITIDDISVERLRHLREALGLDSDSEAIRFVIRWAYEQERLVITWDKTVK